MTVTPYSPPPALDRPTGETQNPARELAGSLNLRVILFLLAHMPLAFAMEMAWPLATVHALLVLLAGVRWAWLGRTRHVLACMAYIAGAEVLWRMTEARVFWEYGKYALALVALMALFAEWRRADGRLRTFAPVVLLLATLPAESPQLPTDGLERLLALGLLEAVDETSVRLHRLVARFVQAETARPGVADLDAARAAVVHLAALGPYEFNGSAGEAQRLRSPVWLDADDCLTWLDTLARASGSGDLYARLREP